MLQYLRQIHGLPAGVRLFMISEAFLGIGLGIFNLVFNLHLLALHINEEKIGQITALGTVVMGGFSFLLGWYLDKWGRKRVLLTGILLMGIGSVTVALGQNIVQFYAAQTVYSLGLAMLVSAEFPLLFLYCNNAQQETLSYSMVFAVFTFFTGAGTWLGGVLPGRFGGGTTVYQNALFVSGIVIFLVFLLRSFLPSDRNLILKADTTQKRLSWLPSRTVLIFIGFSAFLGGSAAIVIPFFNIIIKYRFAWPDGHVAMLLTVNGLFLFLSSFFSPFFYERWGLKKTAFFVFAFSIIPSLLLGMVLPLFVFIPLFFVRNGIFTALTNLLEGQALQAVPDKERGLLSSMRSVARNVSSSLMSLTAGMILLEKNYSLPFVLSGVLLAGCFIYFKVLVSPLLEPPFESRLPAEGLES